MTSAAIEFDAAAMYRVKVNGPLESSWSDQLGGMTIATKTKGDGPPVTTLSGELMDEAAFRGVGGYRVGPSEHEATVRGG